MIIAWIVGTLEQHWVE